MASAQEIDDVVTTAKRLLARHDIKCNTSSDDLVRWFEADTPFPDLSLDEVLKDRRLVIHELVEIDVVKNMGMRIEKDTILKNLERVDLAHLKAAAIEIKMAQKLGEYNHIKEMIPAIEKWRKDESVTPAQKSEYGKLLAVAMEIARSRATGRQSDRGRRWAKHISK